MIRSSVFLPPLSLAAMAAPWVKSVGLAALLGGAASVGLSSSRFVLPPVDEELGAEMLIEIAPVVASAASVDSVAAPDAAAEDRPPTPEVDEAQSKKVERDLPTEQASPVPPDEDDLRMAQEKTLREKEDAAEEEQATEAMKAQAASASSQAAEASEAADGRPEEDVAAAPDLGNSAVGRRRIAEWQKRLFGHIARHKTYPEAARKLRATGETILAFRVARDGGVSDVHVAKSSGQPVLDKAALDVMRRANPVPALPDELKGASLEFSLPMKFSLK